MPDLDLAELDRLHAEATPGPWHLYRQFVITDGTETKHFTFVYWLANNKGSRTEQNARNAAAIAALHNAYPSLRARIAELERKARAFDAIELGEIEWEYDPSCKEFAARRNCGKNHWATTLIEAIRCANGGETGAEFQS